MTDARVARPALRVALAGQPNAGKTTLFNGLTGSRRRVANYPGVTVERRDGTYTHQGRKHLVVDLPGTYSLSSFSPEERVAQQELLEDRPDVVVVVVDSSALRRSLVLLAQIMHLGANPVLCLNMADEARRAGQRVDVEQMAALLGFPVVETAGHRSEGVDALRAAIVQAADHPIEETRLVLGERLTAALQRIEHSLRSGGLAPALVPWTASRLLVGASEFDERVDALGEGAAAQVRELVAEERAGLETEAGLEIGLYVTERYYGFVDGLVRECLRSPRRHNARATSDLVDTVLVHRVLGLPVFLMVMMAIFWLTFTVGEYPMGWIEAGFGALAELVGGLWPAGSDSPLRSLLVDGVIGGVGGVVVFLPNIVLLFLGLALLEDTGYMARAAFLVDSVMHRFGLHGKSFLPLLTGFGCSIPGILATRTLENERDRLTTMLVLPLMSCGARLPIWMLLIPAFFPPPLRAPMLWLVYLVGVVLALLLALLLRRTVLQGEEPPFVMELPPYRLPTLRALVTKMLERSWLYLRKAGTVILALSIVMWALSSYPQPQRYAVDAQVAGGELEVRAPGAAGAAGRPTLTPAQLEHRRATERLRYSLAGRLGVLLEPLLAPLGFDWRLSASMVSAFVAKELFVAQMGIVYSLGEADGGSEDLRAAIARDYSPRTGLSLILFLLIGMPCMATVAVTRRESGRWGWALLQLGGLTGVAYLVALTVYQVGGLLGFG